MADNPLLHPSTLDCQYPHFDRILPDHFAPAFDAAIASYTADIDAIAANDAPVTFDNTIAALDSAGQELARVSNVFHNLFSSDRNEQLSAVDEVYAPKLAALDSYIEMHPGIFAKVVQLYEKKELLELDGPSLRLLEETYKRYVLAGANLDDAARSRLTQLNIELAELCSTFDRLATSEMNSSAVLFETAAELDGLSSDDIQAAKEAAEVVGKRGYLIPIGYPTGQPLAAEMTNAQSRQRLHDASIARCSRDNANNTHTLIVDIANRRLERAKLLGFATHADYVIASQTAPTREAVTTMIHQLATRAAANALSECDELVARAGGPVTAADWSFYVEQVRAERFAVDTAEVSSYLELWRVIEDGVFFAANRLYGLSFIAREDLPKYHPDIKTWEVRRGDDVIGIFIGDYFARPSKRGGAWMNSYVSQSHSLGTKPVICNNLNIIKAPDSAPQLISLDELTTLFHEFGHALHGLLSDVTYVSQSGTNVPRDFVEYPSQQNEMWALWPEVLANYARNVDTGEPLPTSLADSIKKMETFGQGFVTTEYLAAVVIDLAWHCIEEPLSLADVLEFEHQALSAAGLALDNVPPRYRGPYFQHIFGGGYGARYYSYIWSEVLDADTEQWFIDNGGLTRENGRRYEDAVLSRGDTVDPIEAFTSLRGREASIEPLLARRNLR